MHKHIAKPSTGHESGSRTRNTLRKLPARERLIRCGVTRCTQAGFQVPSIDEILRASAVPQVACYYYFKNKHEFGLAVIDAYADYFSQKLRRIFDDSSISPLQRLDRFVLEAQDGMERHAFLRGCLIGNLGMELASMDDDFRNRLENVLRMWERQTSNCLRLAQQAHEIAP